MAFYFGVFISDITHIIIKILTLYYNILTAIYIIQFPLHPYYMSHKFAVNLIDTHVCVHIYVSNAHWQTDCFFN